MFGVGRKVRSIVRALHLRSVGGRNLLCEKVGKVNGVEIPMILNIADS